MKRFTGDELYLVLKDALDERGSHIGMLRAGADFLVRLRQELASLEQALGLSQDKLPLAAELAAADQRHDALGRGVRAVCDACTENPLVDPQTQARAARVRDAFVPNAGEWIESYAMEAARASQRRPKLDELGAELLALQTPDGLPLQAWVVAYLNAGRELEVLLSQRATLLQRDPALLAASRYRILALLQDLRNTIQAEVRLRPDLPRDLEARIFAYVARLLATKASPEPAGEASKAPA